MDVKTINSLLLDGNVDRDDMWPRLVEMESKAAQFRFEFGLDELPTQPGLITIRGARQYGKSTWLDTELRWTIQKFGKGTAFYLNGDEITSYNELEEEMKALYASYPKSAQVKRLFIDEITAIKDWQKAIKRIIDKGLYRDVLIVTTGSKAADLRHGTERLPGRKGTLPQTDFIFLPVSYREFKFHAGKDFGDKTWIAYLLTGGSPVACNDIYQFERLPEYFIQLTRDWILGEIVESGRSRLALHQIFQVLFNKGSSPVGYAMLARESGLANNTVASGYIERLSDLLSVLPAWPWDSQKDFLMIRKACKFHFINLATAFAFHHSAPRHVHEFEMLTPKVQSQFLEWLVAQEIWRRSVLKKCEQPEALGFWSSKEHEIDFVTPDKQLIEVKRGRAGPLDFTWFHKVFPKQHLTVICNSPFETNNITGMTIDQFLLNAPTTLYYEEDD